MKVLVPVDGSRHSLKAVETAGETVRAHPPSAMLLLSVNIYVGGELEEGRMVSEKIRVQAEAALSRAEAVAKENGVTPRLLLATAVSAADEIVRVADEEKVDLVVIGSRGMAARTRFFLGGTAAKVVTYAPCSVLVVKVPGLEPIQ
ncbi:MAG: universal stress protein [Pseudomonadota bacterium]